MLLNSNYILKCVPLHYSHYRIQKQVADSCFSSAVAVEAGSQRHSSLFRLVSDGMESHLNSSIRPHHQSVANSLTIWTLGMGKTFKCNSRRHNPGGKNPSMILTIDFETIHKLKCNLNLT